MSASAMLPQIPARQRENVREHMLYVPGVTLADAIDSAIRRENTRAIRVDSHGIRVETVLGLCSPEHYRVEAYDTATGVMVDSRGGIPAAWLDRYAADLWAEVWNTWHEDVCPECVSSPCRCMEPGRCPRCLELTPCGCPTEMAAPATIGGAR